MKTKTIQNNSLVVVEIQVKDESQKNIQVSKAWSKHYAGEVVSFDEVISHV